MTFLKSWDKTAQDRHTLVRKIWVFELNQIWRSLTWSWLYLGSNLKINVTIKLCVTYDAYNMCRMTRKQLFDCWPYLTWPWPWPLLSKRSILICYLLHPLGNLLAELGLAVVISPVPVADKAKNDDFELWPDLDLTWPLNKICKNCLKSAHRELSLAASPTSLRPRVLKLGRGQNPPPPQRGVFGQMPQRGAG